MKQATKDAITDATLNYLNNSAYRDDAGNPVQGNSFSYILEVVSQDVNLRYANGRHANVTEENLEALGFKIISGRNERNQRCRIVTL